MSIGLLFLDSSVLVAALLPWHEHHRIAQAGIRRANSEGDVCLASRSLIETYAVLTRLPAPHRLAPTDAFRLLDLNFRQLPLHRLRGNATWDLLADLPKLRVAGGATYDAEIVRVALEAGAERVLTLDRRGFARSARPHLEIEVLGS